MPLLPLTIRRLFAGVAAATALSGLTPQASAQFSLMTPRLPESCVPFDGDFSRREYLYDEPLSLLIEQLKRYSGWATLRERMKVGKVPYDGLCASQNASPPFEPFQAQRAIGMNIVNPVTKENVDPELFSILLRDDQYPIVSILAGTLSGMATQMQPNGNPLITDDDSINERIILMTAVNATVITERLLVAAEAAARHNRDGEINMASEHISFFKDEIFLALFQAMATAYEERLLSDDEQTAFRQTVYTTLLKNLGLRRKIGLLWAEEKSTAIEENAPSGFNAAATGLRHINLGEIQAKLAHFPGNLAKTPFLNEYTEHWQSRATEDLIPYYVQTLKERQRTVKPAP